MNEKNTNTAYVSQAGRQWDGVTVTLPATVVTMCDSLINGRVESFTERHELKAGERYEVGSDANWTIE